MTDVEMMNLSEDDKLKDVMKKLENILMDNHRINPNLYVEYDVKRGLRDSAGKGVLTGLTEISDVSGYTLVNGRQIPTDGELYYQGVYVIELIPGQEGRRDGVEETIYLLLFGKLPTEDQLNHFIEVLFDLECLSGRFVRDVVMKASNSNIMNALQRCILTLYTYDENPDDVDFSNVLRQCMELIHKIPLIAVYTYNAY